VIIAIGGSRPSRAAWLHDSDRHTPGQVRPALTTRYGLDQATDAMRVLDTGHSTGNAVITQ
jgi:hypothetical protein